MNIFKIIEISSVVSGLLYVVLIMRQNIWCWLFGIVSSALYILSCIHAKLYLEGGLNFYYVAVGFYGWFLWLQKNRGTGDKTFKVSEWRVFLHITNILVCILLSIVLGKVEQYYTDSPRPFFDAAITVFSFSATILEARKILSAWIYWFVINGASIVLMIDRGMNGYAILSAVTTALCVKGYFDWRKGYWAQGI
ncbi:hypothetical protein A9P82_07110 [Arachidicoccus ginsenosidimutans]|uniref:nicotinamide riboside transporter PnuC n=1 Tax=Arachidicoccus sp. BS20 TaxID=1850526 RepID=UPI0007F1435C|nr:nicotinamide riboside transporter PnuC [Arachidicoccus sp. BS20]ANI89078.1 hypothetical protein A9P82_07110 [Arachidicoccus sp. BS20]